MEVTVNRKYIVRLTTEQMRALLFNYEHTYQSVVSYGGVTVHGIVATDDPGVLYCMRYES